jgi:signal transduction histidine kinase/CheY-like chemotaxis protein
MKATASEPPIGNTVLPEYQALDDLRQQVLWVVLPGSTLAGMVILLWGDALGWSLEIQLIGFALTVWPLMSMAVRYYWRRTSLAVIMIGYLSLALLSILWLDPRIVTPLLTVPVILTGVLLGYMHSLILTILLSALLLFYRGPLEMPALLRFTTLLLIWSAQWLTWVIMRFAMGSVEWAHASYEQNRVLLEAARDQRVQAKQVQQDLLQANTELARVTNRLDVMRQMAEDARRVKEEFVANVSHELRTPLNMIIGFSELLVESPGVYGDELPAGVLSDISVILRNSRHLAGLIDDILDLSQVEAGRWALTKERVPVAEIVESAVSAVSPLFRSKDLFLETDVPEGIGPVFCDRTRIREVVLNLLSNAGRFTDRGGVRVSARTDGPDVVVEVADSGPGIPEESQKRLFQPFEQLDGSIRRLHGGSGLGLSISKAFVELHGGEMWLESQSGIGTRVSFRLPIDPPTTPAPGLARWFNVHAPFEERRRPRQALHAPLRPRYVVIEREDSLQRVLNRYMDQADIVPVRTIQEALAELGRVPAQALLVNDASVSDALLQLSRSGDLPFGTPAIVCSVPGLHEAAEAHGISGYLVKPILSRQILFALDQLGLERGTILVVDDEPEALRLFHRILVSSGREYRVLRAADGRQALDILHDERPDAILLDLVMPNMDGFQVLEWRNADPDLRQVPVLIISARDPLGQPIISNALGLVRGGGLSIAQVISCIEALTAIVGPLDQPGDPTRPEMPPG